MLGLIVLAVILFLVFGGIGFIYNPLFLILAAVLLFVALGGGYYGRGRGNWNR